MVEWLGWFEATPKTLETSIFQTAKQTRTADDENASDVWEILHQQYIQSVGPCLPSNFVCIVCVCVPICFMYRIKTSKLCLFGYQGYKVDNDIQWKLGSLIYRNCCQQSILKLSSTCSLSHILATKETFTHIWW